MAAHENAPPEATDGAQIGIQANPLLTLSRTAVKSFSEARKKGAGEPNARAWRVWQGHGFVKEIAAGGRKARRGRDRRRILGCAKMTVALCQDQPTVVEIVEDLGFELIFETASLIESFATSLREAAIAAIAPRSI